MAEEKDWQGKTFGSNGLLESLIWTLRVTDVRIIYVTAYIFVVPVFVVVNWKNAKWIYKYFREIRKEGKFSSFLDMWRTHNNFAETLIDKFAMYAGKKFDVKATDYEPFNRLQEKGFVQLSAHIGNFEMAGYTQESTLKKMNVIVYGGEKETVLENRRKMLDKGNINMILLKDDGSHIFEINKALEHHEIISIPADRGMGGKTIETEFMGKKAKLPMGPFAVATINGTDVLAINVMKTGTKRYTIYIKELEYDRTLPRRQQMKQLAELYAKNIGETMDKYPTQWYNFYDFWKE